MSINQSDVMAEVTSSQRPLRLWPGVVAAVLCLVRYGLPLIAPEAAMYAMLGGLACGLAIVVWWLFFSRAAWPERVAAIALMIVALLLTSRVAHISLADGMMGMLVFLYGLPVVGAAFVAAVVVSRRWSVGYRRAAMASAILLACAAFTLLRTEGIAGDGASAFARPYAARCRSGRSTTGRIPRPASAKSTWWPTAAHRSPARSSRH